MDFICIKMGISYVCVAHNSRRFFLNSQFLKQESAVARAVSDVFDVPNQVLLTTDRSYPWTIRGISSLQASCWDAWPRRYNPSQPREETSSTPTNATVGKVPRCLRPYLRRSLPRKGGPVPHSKSNVCTFCWSSVTKQSIAV